MNSLEQIHEMVYYDQSRKILICLAHGYSLSNAKPWEHFRSPTHPDINQNLLGDIKAYTMTLDLQTPQLAKLPVLLPQSHLAQYIPNLNLYKGFRCTVHGCSICLVSLKKVKEHVSKDHPKIGIITHSYEINYIVKEQYPPEAATLQTIFPSPNTLFFPVSPPSSKLAVSTPINFSNELQRSKHNIAKEITFFVDDTSAITSKGRTPGRINIYYRNGTQKRRPQRPRMSSK
jgi:hypothetical protein